MDKKEIQGHMYLAKKPCGRVVAAAWDDKGHEKDTAKSVARWIARGDAVERIAVYKGDAQPEWVCSSVEQCKCRDNGLRA